MKTLINVKSAEKVTDTVMHILDRAANLLTWFAVPAAAYVIVAAILKAWGM